MSIPISRLDALAMRRHLQIGRVDLVMSAIDELIERRRGEVQADLAGDRDPNRIAAEWERFNAELPDVELSEPVVHHGTINIDGQDHAIRLEIHSTEGGAFDADGHAVEDDGFTTIDLSGITSKSQAHAMARHKLREVFAPDHVEERAARWAAEIAAFEITTGDPRFDPDRAVRINGLAFVRVGCARCGSKPAVTNLDGDDLCQSCADKWVRAEGCAAQDAAREQGASE